MQAARGWLKDARRVTVLTGAGVSAESGIPTFRGSQGLWKQFRAEELATPEAFARDPKLVWEWYDWRRHLIAEAKPNAGHHALAAIEARVPKFTLITQNVDDLHERAGSRNVLHVHGSIWTVRCTECGFEQVDKRVPLPEIPPLHRCDTGRQAVGVAQASGPVLASVRAPKRHTGQEACATRNLLRPGVVWFGESLPQNIWAAAENAASEADVFLVIGTSAIVYPAAGLARVAKAGGARVVEINAAETPLTALADESLQGASGEVLPSLIA
jgi:NAD-dependent protein deacetylase/lipoamidase